MLFTCYNYHSNNVTNTIIFIKNNNIINVYSNNNYDDYDNYETNKELLRAQVNKNLSETGFLNNYQSKEFIKLMNENFYNSQRIIVNNPSCFLPSEVTEAQGHIKLENE